MKIEAIRKNGPEMPRPNLNDMMIRARVGSHDPAVAYVLGTAAAWSYADLDTFSRAMYMNGLGPHEAVSINVTNPALLVNSTAYLIQSMDKRLAIICFRGTDPNDRSNWLADMSASAEPFLSTGRVHGGFLRSTLAISRQLGGLLKSTRNGSICDAAIREKADFAACIAESPDCQRSPSPATTTDSLDQLEALYVTGHSLGGAMAVIGAALLYAAVDPDTAFFQDKLRGIYTFGQPMVGHEDFTEIANKDFGNKLFRHVHGNDIVARLPPRTAGRFVHFGTEYTSSESGWRYQTKLRSPAPLITTSLTLAILDWLHHQLPVVPVLRRLNPTWSVRDHGPIYYLRTSQKTAIGTEFTGDPLTPGVR